MKPELNQKQDHGSILSALRDEAATGLHVFFAPATAVARVVLSAFHDPQPPCEDRQNR